MRIQCFSCTCGWSQSWQYSESVERLMTHILRVLGGADDYITVSAFIGFMFT